MPGAAPTLIPRPSMGPVPRVEFSFRSLATGTERATVFRVTAERTQRVRGYINVYAAGGFSGVDTEPPFGWPVGPDVTYRAEQFTAAGVSLGLTDAAVTTVNFKGVVIHQPTDPSRAVLAEPEARMAQKLTRPFEGKLIRPIGRSRPVFIGAGRGALENIDLTVITRTAEQAADMQSIFGGYDDPQLPVICVRTSLPMRLPQPLFAAVLAPSEIPFDNSQGGTTIVWEMTGDEAAPPVEAIARALLTYADLEASFATYAALESAYLTYFDAESDYNLAGRGTA
jgi:hypothetical protein